MVSYHDFENDETVKLLRIQTWETFRRYTPLKYFIDTYDKNPGKSFSQLTMEGAYNFHADHLHGLWDPKDENGKAKFTHTEKDTKLVALKASFRFKAARDNVWAQLKARYNVLVTDDALLLPGQSHDDPSRSFANFKDEEERLSFVSAILYDPSRDLREEQNAAREMEESQERNSVEDSEVEELIDVSDCSDPETSEDELKDAPGAESLKSDSFLLDQMRFQNEERHAANKVTKKAVKMQIKREAVKQKLSQERLQEEQRQAVINKATMSEDIEMVDVETTETGTTTARPNRRPNRRPKKQSANRIARMERHELSKALKNMSVKDVLKHPEANISSSSSSTTKKEQN